METAPATPAPSAAPASTPPAASAPAAPASGGSSQHTPAAQASMPPQVNVNANGQPGAAPAAPAAPAGTPKWNDSFDPDLKEYVSQKGFQDPKSVVESYRNLEKLRGVPADRLLKLPETADAPEWNDVYSKLGKPATPEGYGLKPKDPKDPNFTNWATDTFHKLNLTAQQGQELANKFNEMQEGILAQEKAQYTQKLTEQTGKLQKEWGAAYNQNIATAQRAARQFAVPGEAIDAMEKAIGFDQTMKFFNRLGASMGEHSFESGSGSNQFGDPILTPEQAGAKIKALKQDKTWSDAYLKGGTKERAELERLLKMQNPS